ncbi:MAG TPA: GntR family transcriptional regulator [Trebonia sp.]|jgi:GntR family transcriptional regulator|nr:GntR family transcriptional regulator [Trebonia sp.]
MVREASGGRPKYWLIAAGLREAIESGRYPPGSRLPGENDVMKDHGVARGTARQALTQLVNWGIAEPRKGSGIYVRDFRPIIREGVSRLGQATWPSGQSIWSAESQGRDLSVDQIEVRQADPPAHIRELLCLAADGKAVLRSRRFVLDGKPVLLSRSWLPAAIASGTAISQPDTGPGGTYARLADLGHAPARFREDLRSRMPQPDEADRLDIKPGTPVIDIIRLAVDGDGTPVEVNEMTADSSAYIFRYEFPA